MTSVFSNVTSWLGVSRERDSSPEGEREPASNHPTENEPETSQDASNNTEGEDSATCQSEQEDTKTGLPIDVQEVSEKALHTAKEWGSYLYNVGKAATEQVAKTAKQFRETVEEKTIIGEFSREQEKFVCEHREKKKQSEAAVPPWVGYNEEETMKTQILALSKDKRNFLRNPPAGVQFHFDYEASFPIAMVMLEEDQDLKDMRFKIVPKEIKEEVFWRNYFYRVSLIKQSTQLTSLAQHNVPKTTVTRSPAAATKSDSNSPAAVKDADSEEMPVGSPLADHEFVSDSYQTGNINADELKKEMDQLGMSDKMQDSSDDVPEWERELQAELQEYEVVDDGNNITDADLEQEIMKQIEAESQNT